MVRVASVAVVQGLVATHRSTRRFKECALFSMLKWCLRHFECLPIVLKKTLAPGIRMKARKNVRCRALIILSNNTGNVDKIGNGVIEKYSDARRVRVGTFAQ